MNRTRTPAFIALLALLSALAASACGGTSGASGGGDGSGGTLTLVAYSTPEEAYAEIIPAFNKTEEGKGVGFKESYASSGEQSRKVQGGLPADLVHLSLAPDVDKLVDAGLVEPDWNSNENEGFVSSSVVVFAVRKGNPKNIRQWSDLTKKGVEVVTPNPFTSGGAKWNLMAAYGSQIEQGKSEDEAVGFLRDLLANVDSQDKSARESLGTFTGGKGDVLIAYENEAIAAQQAGEDLEYVIPDETILIQNPAAVIKSSTEKEKAQAFVDYLTTEPAQKLFAAKGYRPLLPALVDKGRFPDPKTQFEIEKFGGWGAVNDKFFEPETGLIAEINRDQGEATE